MKQNAHHRETRVTNLTLSGMRKKSFGPGTAKVYIAGHDRLQTQRCGVWGEGCGVWSRSGRSLIFANLWTADKSEDKSFATSNYSPGGGSLLIRESNYTPLERCSASVPDTAPKGPLLVSVILVTLPPHQAPCCWMYPLRFWCWWWTSCRPTADP